MKVITIRIRLSDADYADTKRLYLGLNKHLPLSIFEKMKEVCCEIFGKVVDADYNIEQID